MWKSVRAMSMCTGAYTAEMAMAVATSVVNNSGRLREHVHVTSVATWDWVGNSVFALYMEKVSNGSPHEYPPTTHTARFREEKAAHCTQCIVDSHA